MSNIVKPTMEVTFDNGSSLHCYTAKSIYEKIIGLNSYSNLTEGEGLWFTFVKNSYPMFWNRGVQYPIDIAFLSPNTMKINNIFSLEKNSSAVVMSDVPSRYVIEVRAGVLKKLGIKTGAQVLSVRSLE